jgi:hypothetical protein
MVRKLPSSTLTPREGALAAPRRPRFSRGAEPSAVFAGFPQRIVELVRKGRTPKELARQFEPSAQAIRNR